MTKGQLALDLGGRVSHAREDFVEGDANRAALAWVDRWPDWPARGLTIIGPEGSGKSHLASLWAARSGAARLDPAGPFAAGLSGAILVEDFAGTGDERGLFHLYNRLMSEGGWLLLTSRLAPVQWPIALPDLRSRLLALPVATLAPPDDLLLAGVLAKLFADRNLPGADRVVPYLVTRMERSYAAARRIVAAIDREALALQRDVTVPLAARILAELDTTA